MKTLRSFVGQKLQLIELPHSYFGIQNVKVGNYYEIVDVEGSNFWYLDDNQERRSCSYTRFKLDN